MKKILITGNSGYIGSHLTKLLANLPNTKLYGLDLNPPQIAVERHYIKDIRDVRWNLDDIEFDCIIHLAAVVSVAESVLDPELYYDTNIFGTLNLLKNLKTKNFICASTGAAKDMANPYGISKRAMEDIVTDFCKKNNINFVIFRFYNVVGSDGINPTNPDGLFYNLMKANKTKKFKLFGDDYNTPDGSCIRDYTHVNEICNALLLAIEKQSLQIENLGHGIGTSVKEMIDIFKKVNRCEFEITVCPKRPGDLEKSVLDNPSQYMKKLYTMEELLKI